MNLKTHTKMSTTTSYTCKNSTKSIDLHHDADTVGRILAVACQDGEYWFTIGWYKTETGALRSAKKQLARLGYELNA